MRPREALADFDQAIELGLQGPEIRVNRGAVRHNLALSQPPDALALAKGAVADFESALGQAPAGWPMRSQVEGFLKSARDAVSALERR
jgi:hypothetical protein